MLLLLLMLLTGFIIGANIFVSVDDLKPCQAQPTTGNCAPADAIVAVSGGDTEARAAESIALYQKGWAKTLVFAGAAKDPESPSNALVMKGQALAAGVPEDAILMDDMSINTPENAENIYAIAQKHDIHSVIVVTSPYHQLRTSVLFKKAFAGYGDVRSHPTTTDKNWSTFWWIQPYNWYLVTGEMIKTLPALAQ